MQRKETQMSVLWDPKHESKPLNSIPLDVQSLDIVSEVLCHVIHVAVRQSIRRAEVLEEVP